MTAFAHYAKSSEVNKRTTGIEMCFLSIWKTVENTQTYKLLHTKHSYAKYLHNPLNIVQKNKKYNIARQITTQQKSQSNVETAKKLLNASLTQTNTAGKFSVKQAMDNYRLSITVRNITSRAKPSIPQHVLISSEPCTDSVRSTATGGQTDRLLQRRSGPNRRQRAHAAVPLTPYALYAVHALHAVFEVAVLRCISTFMQCIQQICCGFQQLGKCISSSCQISQI